MIIVLGGGPAGRIAAIRLASAGKDTTLVESSGIGGQCLHSGCMPVCALNDAARFIRQARVFRNLGITTSYPSIDFGTLQKEMAEIQQKIGAILDKETRDAGVGIVYGKHGRLTGRQAYIADEPVESEAVIAATGSRPNVPKIEGIGLHGVYSPNTLPAMRQLQNASPSSAGG